MDFHRYTHLRRKSRDVLGRSQTPKSTSCQIGIFECYKIRTQSSSRKSELEKSITLRLSLRLFRARDLIRRNTRSWASGCAAAGSSRRCAWLGGGPGAAETPRRSGPLSRSGPPAPSLRRLEWLLGSGWSPREFSPKDTPQVLCVNLYRQCYIQLQLNSVVVAMTQARPFMKALHVWL